MAKKKEFFDNHVALQGIYADGSLGLAGQVLKSDGENVYWGTDSSSGGDAATLQGHPASDFVLVTDYSDADVLAKILNVDGSGSLLDSDFLRGYTIGTSGNAIPLLDGTNTWSKSQIVNDPTTTSYISIGGSNSFTTAFILDSNAGQTRRINFRSAGVNRWQLYTTNTAESGTNAGSNFSFDAYSDAGASLGTVFTVARSTRVLNFTVAPTFTDAATTLTNLGALPSSSYTAADVFSKVLSLDGSGSGLDADLLDGQHGAYYAAASSLASYLPLAGGTLSGLVTSNFGASNSIGITVGNSQSILDISGGDGGYSWIGSRTWGFELRYGASNASTGFRMSNTGVLYQGAGANLIWHAGNDGSGSGLDADTTDGYHLNQNVLTTSSPTFAAILSTDHITVQGAFPFFQLYDTDAPTNAKYWRHYADGGAYIIDLVNDAYSASYGGMALSRSGTSATGMEWFGTLFRVGSTGGVSSGLITSSNYPYIDIIDQDGGSNQTIWRMDAGGAVIGLMTLSDAYGTPNYVFTADRTGATINYVNLAPTGAVVRIGSSYGTAWHSANDGAASGLDADLLDGYNSAITAGAASTVVVRTSAGGISATGADGFYAETYAVNSRNPIYRFGNATAYGISYFQGSSGYSGANDSVGIHFGTATGVGSTFAFSGTGVMYITNNVVWHAGNDGSGSGLDADLLDGYNVGTSGGAIPLLNGNNTWSGGTQVFQTVTDEAIRIARTGGYISFYNTANNDRHGYILQDATGLYIVNEQSGGVAISGTTSLTYNGNTVWHAGNDGSGSGLDADTLDGYHAAAFPLQNGTFNTTYIGFTHVGSNSGMSAADYAIYQEAGAWSGAYPDLIFTFHTGLKIMSTAGYGGTKFYTSTPSYVGSDTPIFVVGNGDNTVAFNSKSVTSKTTDGFGLEFLLNGAYEDGRYAHRLVKWDDGGGVPMYLQSTQGTAGAWTSLVRFGAYSGDSAVLEVFGAIKAVGVTSTSTMTIASGSPELHIAETGAATDEKDWRLIPSGGDLYFQALNEAYSSASTFIRVNRTGYGVDLIALAAGNLTMNGSTVWHAGNDGSTSGLDADLIDGLHASSLIYSLHSGFGWGSNDAVSNMNAVGGHTSTTQRSGFSSYNNPTNSPNGDWVHWITHLGNSWSSGSEYGFQIAHGFWNNNMWVRKVNSGTWGSWVKMWNADNDGSGSGLDADLLDGYHVGTSGAAIPIMSAANLFSNQQAIQMQSSLGIAAATGAELSTLEARGNGTGAAVITFHRPAAFAAYLGIDTDNVLKYGGWSVGGVAHTVWYSGNDGSGSGLDADLLDGCQLDSSANASTVVKRDASGHIYGADILTTSGYWFRSTGDVGWYNNTHGGGIYMTDSTWVKVYGSKAFYVTNDIAATGNITAYYSDDRLKERTGIIIGALDKIESLDTFYYKENAVARSLGYKNTEEQVGMSAQQIKKVLPHVVRRAPVDIHTSEDGTQSSKSGQEYLTVDYARVMPLAVAALKELRAELRAEVAALRAELAAMRNK